MEERVSTESSVISLDAEEIRKLVGSLKREEQVLFAAVVRDVKDRGDAVSEAVVDELAKKFADKAKLLAGDGGGS